MTLPKLKVLVIGSLPPPVGGCSVTLQHLVDELRRRADLDVRVLDTARIRGGGLSGGLRLASVVRALPRMARKVDVVTLHVATSALPHWGLVVEEVARRAGRPFILRKFADTDYLALGPLRGRLAAWVAARSTSYLAETRRHLDEASRRGLRAHWFPTARPLPAADPARREPERCRSFAYLGHVTALKGIPQLLQAFETMPEDVTLHVHGPLLGDVPASTFAGRARVRWHGPIRAQDAVRVLAGHDALVLPTVASTEGYPGSILEAFTAGLPVVASRIGGIPEIVDASAGLLVPPGDVLALRSAMERLARDPELYRQLRRGAREAARQFSTERWADVFVGHCRDAAGTRALQLASPSAR